MSKLPNVTVYKRDDIIRLINGISPVEECMIRDIIAEYDKEMGEAIVDNKIVVCCVLFILFAALFICLVRFFQKFLLKSYHKKISQFK